MEILAELLFGLVGFLFEFFGELLVQLAFQSLFEIGAHVFQRKSLSLPENRSSPWVGALTYLGLGLAIGAISLLIVPGSMIHSFFYRVAYLLLMPFASGAFMSLMGAWRRKRGDELVRIDRFWYGFLFAFGMGLVRFIHAQGWWGYVLGE
ncbi:MAG: hypothetical protein H7255_04130 [Ramlibacter sp.]|nr:hypothetical protein [Ramlibacter sp.]